MQVSIPIYIYIYNSIPIYIIYIYIYIQVSIPIYTYIYRFQYAGFNTHIYISTRQIKLDISVVMHGNSTPTGGDKNYENSGD